MALVQVYLDGNDITSIVDEGSVTKRLNRPSVGQIRFPSKLASIKDFSKVKIVLNGTLDINGEVEGPAAIEVDGGVNDIWTTLQFADALTYLDSRRSMDADGDWSNPTFMYSQVTGPQIIRYIVQNTKDRISDVPLLLGNFATGGTDLSGAPTNWPMMISEVITLLTDTGECDVYLEPIDSGGYMGILHAFNGNFGVDRTASVSFGYKAGAYNVTECRMVIDKSGLANSIRYLLGPRVKTAKDPGALQHWDASIEITDMFVPQVLVLAQAFSKTFYGTREDTRIFDAQGDSNTLPRELYKRHFLLEAWLRCKPKLMVSLTPQPGIVPTFGVGDLIHVEASGPEFTVESMTAGNAGFQGTQRVMEYTYRFDKNGVVELGAPEGQAGAAAVTTTAVMEGLS